MAKNFYELLDEIKGNVSVDKKGKVKKTFSRTDFEKLARAYVNTPEVEATVVKMKEGVLVTDKTTPVKSFRNMIRTILVNFGVDKAEAEKVMDASYEIKTSEMYEFVSELLYRYMEAGKKFEFLTKEDFKGSISIVENGESVKPFLNPKTKEKGNKLRKAHKTVKAKSSCPDWLKSDC